MSRSNQTEDARGAETRALVQAAEAVMARAFADRKLKGDLSKSQMSQLIGVCQEAACHEEVANYLRYQAGRRGAKWTQDLVDAVIKGIKGDKGAEALIGIEDIFRAQGVPDDADAARMDRWRRYATYLARAFTWHDAVEREGRRR